MQCKAQSKRTHERCRDRAMKGREVCYHHGGMSLVGPAVTHKFKTGRHSRYLPARMADKYNQAQRDPELLSLHDEVALLDARIADLFTRVDAGESEVLRGRLHKEWEEFRLVRASGDVPKMHMAMARLDALMAHDYGDYHAWAELSEKLEQRRKLCESESRRLVAMRQMLGQEQALLLAGALVDAVTRHVLAIPSALPQDQPEVRALVEVASKRALSGVIVDLQVLMTRDQVPVYAEAAG